MRFKKLSNKNVKELRQIAQNGGGYFPERIFRTISLYFSIFFLYLGVTPTAITFIRFYIGLVGILFISFGGYSWTLTGLLVFHFAILLDYVDGEMFRYLTWKNKGKKETVLVGPFLDKVFDQIFRPFLLVAAGVGAYFYLNNINYIILGALGASLIVIDQLIKLKTLEVLVYRDQLSYLKQQKSHIAAAFGKYDWVYELFRINNPLTLYFWFGIFGYLHYFLIIYTVLLVLLTVKTFNSQYGSIKSMDKEVVAKLYKK